MCVCIATDEGHCIMAETFGIVSLCWCEGLVGDMQTPSKTSLYMYILSVYFDSVCARKYRWYLAKFRP